VPSACPTTRPLTLSLDISIQSKRINHAISILFFKVSLYAGNGALKHAGKTIRLCLSFQLVGKGGNRVEWMTVGVRAQ